MASIVDICNIALSNIRAGSINSLQEGSLQAQQCSLKYPLIRDTLLTQAHWGFAGNIAKLAVLTTTVPHWNYAYQYPPDCLQIRKLMLPNGNVPAYILDKFDAQIPYKIMNPTGNNRIIVANVPTLEMDYTVKVEDPNMFDESFIQALTWMMAAELAVPIVGSETGRPLRSDALEMYKSYLATAVTDTLNEQFHQTRESDFITVRQ